MFETQKKKSKKIISITVYTRSVLGRRTCVRRATAAGLIASPANINFFVYIFLVFFSSRDYSVVVGILFDGTPGIHASVNSPFLKTTSNVSVLLLVGRQNERSGTKKKKNYIISCIILSSMNTIDLSPRTRVYRTYIPIRTE